MVIVGVELYRGVHPGVVHGLYCHVCVSPRMWQAGEQKDQRRADQVPQLPVRRYVGRGECAMIRVAGIMFLAR